MKSGLPTNIRKKFMRDDWFLTRPTVIKVLIKKLKPWKRYRIKETGQHCVIVSYNEHWTVTVFVTGHDDPLRKTLAEIMRMEVFGINPNSLEILK